MTFITYRRLKVYMWTCTGLWYPLKLRRRTWEVQCKNLAKTLGSSSNNYVTHSFLTFHSFVGQILNRLGQDNIIIIETVVWIWTGSVWAWWWDFIKTIMFQNNMVIFFTVTWLIFYFHEYLLLATGIKNCIIQYLVEWPVGRSIWHVLVCMCQATMFCLIMVWS